MGNLRQTIEQHFNRNELRAICHDLAIDYEQLRGETKSEIVISLIEYCQRHGRLNDLQNHLNLEQARLNTPSTRDVGSNTVCAKF